MESRSYMFSTAGKRSTLLESKSIFTSFRLESENAPRSKILRKECPEQFKAFNECMARNGKDESKCLEQLGELDKCGKTVFRRVNNDPNYTY